MDTAARSRELEWAGLPASELALPGGDRVVVAHHGAQVLSWQAAGRERLCAVEAEGVDGVICGRSIYSGALDFAAAQARADELNT